MAAGEFQRLVGRLAAVTDELLSVDLTGLERAELVRAIEGFERQRRRLEAVDQRLIMQANDSHLAASCGQQSVAGVLSSVLRVDPREARARAARALDCGPRRALSGEPLEATLPVLAAAMAAGDVSPAQADVIIETIGHVPDAAPPAAWPVAERVLVEAARHEAPAHLRRTARELLERLDPDGGEPAEQLRQRRRAFGLAKYPDGWSRPSGRLSPELTAYLEAMLDSLAAPQPAGDEPDPRTATQRRHDALLEALGRVLRSGTLPECGGVPVTVLATVTMSELGRGDARSGRATRATSDLGMADLATEAGMDLGTLLASSSHDLAVLGHGQTISARSLLAMACEAQVIPVVFNDAGGVLAYGRGRRLASRGQRLALAARDGGCCFPGCDRPAPWTEVHHVREWINGGPTDLDNLCLLCAYHHRSFEQAGWQVVMQDGVPTWIPPAWLDPQQRPRRNTVHHLAEIVFRQPSAA